MRTPSTTSTVKRPTLPPTNWYKQVTRMAKAVRSMQSRSVTMPGPASAAPAPTAGPIESERGPRALAPDIRTVGH
ncbi:hypothetical protein SAMN05216551_10112 [Chitinasiproducens palmae]|uniref:Uncharacterized protein n=1 Tax=Chitinasiproducens palmae TaxID=1770053 RepID=A0A1H2PIB8_9BURK|nr:hypothetical protein SAMN05216551_10112 [Chitinasiproducens palmae]